MTILKEILQSKLQEIESLESLDELKAKVKANHAREIRKASWSDNLDVIAEIKRKSPSKGRLANIEDPASLAISYEQGGATIISVLTDEKYFGALPTDLEKVRVAVSLPVLRKDFIIDERQVYESHLMGADYILLIAAAFENEEMLSQLYSCANDLGLGVLVETHNGKEIEVANNLGAEIIGVNVRDLETFEENAEIGDELITRVRSDSVSVWESSITTLDQAKRARSAGAQAVLIGQGLVQSENPSHFIQQIRNISIP